MAFDFTLNMIYSGSCVRAVILPLLLVKWKLQGDVFSFDEKCNFAPKQNVVQNNELDIFK